jgi:hypothetical protein
MTWVVLLVFPQESFAVNVLETMLLQFDVPLVEERADTLTWIWPTQLSVAVT